MAKCVKCCVGKFCLSPDADTIPRSAIEHPYKVFDNDVEGVMLLIDAGVRQKLHKETLQTTDGQYVILDDRLVVCQVCGHYIDWTRLLSNICSAAGILSDISLTDTRCHICGEPEINEQFETRNFIHPQPVCPDCDFHASHRPVDRAGSTNRTEAPPTHRDAPAVVGVVPKGA